ncbi:type I-E CRISPR-associated protein Cse1/CasA [Streptomyces sp. NPDC014846]|uniref:type I-E CRISPR-associated protein Cse1/CasA n=1 Tax=Streptomyces sp. NPDC014846 TaxID=3364922 RepID=UPI0036FFA6EA
MTPSFSLASAPWIPVHDRDAGAFRDVGLDEALTRAHRLTLPVIQAEEIPLLRLLIAVFDAAAGPRDADAWDAAWKADTLDTNAVTPYLQTWADRLDLFHPTHPALQSAALTDYARGPEALHPGSLGGDSAAWFNHQLYQPLPPYPAPRAARLLLHLLAYDVAGIKRAAPGDPATRAGKVYGSQTGPVASSTHFHLVAPLGTLKDMLLLNLPPRPRAAGDTTAWERGTPAAPMCSRTPAGRLDLLTWPTRRIRLRPTEDGTVDAVAHHDGDRLPDAWPVIERLDPMTAWSTSKAGTPVPFDFLGMDGWPQPWRGALLLDDGSQRSAVLRHVAAAAERGTLDPGLHLQGALSTTVHTSKHRSAVSDIPLATVQLPTAGQLTDPAACSGLATMARYAEAISRNLRLRTAELSRRPMVQVAPRMQLTNLEGAWGAAVAEYAGDPDGARSLWQSAVHAEAERLIDAFPLGVIERGKLLNAYRVSPEPRRERQVRPAAAATAPPTPAASGGRRGPAATRYEVFGGSYSLSQLSEHPDCVVSYKTLRDRVADGWDVERAATTPGSRGRKSR